MDEWATNREVYSETQVEAVLVELGIDIKSETERVFLGSCPFHYNPGSPAFAVNKESGLYYCHNPSCNERGNLKQLVVRVGEHNEFQAIQIISRHYSEIDYVALAERELTPIEFVPFDQTLLDRQRDNFEGSEGELYMVGRGFTIPTLQHFAIGYAPKKRAVVVPMHTEQGIPIGFIGRSIDRKDFQNSFGLVKSQTAWNMHRAKREGSVCIVVESAFDAMRIHQSGYPNVVALLGSSISRYVVQQLEKYFTTIVIMTDNDPLQFNEGICGKCEGNCKGHNPGRDLGYTIEKKVRRKVLWASVGPEVYPHGAKDAGDLTEDEIRHVLSNAVSGVEYSQSATY